MIGYVAAARAVHLASLMSIFGASAYIVLLQCTSHPGPPVRAARALFVFAATLSLASGVMWFCLIAGQMSGSWANSTDLPTLELAASSTRFGQIFMARGAGLAALWLLCAFTRSNPPTVAVLAGLLLASLGPVSHAAAAMNGDIGIAGAANDAVHLLTAGFWLGGLMAVALIVRQHWADPAGLIGPLRLFSRWGTFAVALLVTTGVVNAVSILPLSAMVLRNPYFGLLLVKVALALAMIALASLNRWGITPAIRDGRPRAAGHLAGSVATEIALGIAIVGITALLGLIAPH